MASDLKSAVATARAAWLSNVTVADSNWATRQLHGLSNLLLEHRDDLVSTLVKVYGHNRDVWERELAIVQLDIVAHLKSLNVKNKTLNKKSSKKLSAISKTPRGVSLIITKSENPLRHAIAPLAASIASRNAVVLAVIEDNDVVQLFKDNAAAHLDKFALQLVSLDGGDVPSLPPYDHVLICDELPDRWSKFLASTVPSTFLSTIAGYSLVIVPEGLVRGPDVAHLVVNARSGIRPFDGVDAVFVHQASFDAVMNLVSTDGGSFVASRDNKAPPGLTQVSGTVLAWHPGQQSFSGVGVENAIAVARQRSALLLINSSSTEEIVDSINKLENVAQLTVIGAPNDKATADYIEQWTSSARFSTSSIPMVTPMTDTGFEQPNGTLFPSSLFSNTRLITHGKQNALPGDVKKMRALYEKAIPVLKPEHPGGRIDFFVQVEYAIKTAAALVTVGGIAAVYFCVKHFRHAL
ncbi:hypothetical protein SEUCBS140593_000839 [Sporothrix eucalyptigena]|uniref:Aldehyde dehydrogenase domain-containing protein n=1 Tax=Sporothrix eucalyptigena TaxID=1812306 RepID=A0ABP0AT94_9PEZI